MEKFAVKSFCVKYSWSFVLLAILIPNIFLSYSMELSFDESYYWIYSKFLDFGYYDHPPMVGLSIYLGTLLFGDTEIGVRIFSNLYLFGTIALIWDMVKHNKQELVFWILIASMPLITLNGLIALPDAPLMFFTTLFFWYLKKYIAEDHRKFILPISIVIGMMFYSKYHGLLIVLLTVCGYPQFLKRKTFWLIVLGVVLIFMPHMWWQYQNDFVSFKFHLFGRAEKHFSITNILDYIGGQIVLMGFLNFFLFLYIFYKNKFKDPFERVMLFNSLGFLLFLFLMSFRNQIEANWTISCSIALIILMFPYIERYKKVFLWCSSISLFLFFALKLALFNLPVIMDNMEKENRFNEIIGWKNNRINSITNICKNKVIVGDNYQVTSKLAFYLNNPNIPALHLGSRESQYSLLKLQKQIKEDTEICYLTSKPLKGTFKVKTNYKDAVYIIESTTLGKLSEFYGMTYEEIIRN
jgi:4-amino-4-deoxy-L-arabinose transferase-like glycosyltransferase